MLPKFSLFVVHCLYGLRCYVCVVFDNLIAVMSVWGKLLFCAITCIVAHSFCFLLGFSGIKCILEMWYLYAAVLCSMGWFDVNLTVLSVVVDFRYIYTLRLYFYIFLHIFNNTLLLFILILHLSIHVKNNCFNFSAWFVQSCRYSKLWTLVG